MPLHYSTLTTSSPFHVLTKAISPHVKYLFTSLRPVNASQSNALNTVCYRSFHNLSFLAKKKDPALDRSSDNHNQDDLRKKLILKKSVDNNQTDIQAPKYPIVLCHGFSGFDQLMVLPKKLSFFDNLLNDSDSIPHEINKDGKPSKSRAGLRVKEEDQVIELFEYWYGIKDMLKQKGCKVIVAKVPPFATIETRAQELNKFITKNLYKIKPNEIDSETETDKPIKINLIAHSMGGLDCRFLISKLEKHGYEVASLTTISSPHRGTYAADFALKFLPQPLLNRYFPSVKQLTMSECNRMNNELPNDPNVKYYSYGACFTPNPANFFYITWKIIYSVEGPNDGMISLKSAQWGKYLGYLENVDHLDLINWVGGLTKAKNLWNGTQFDPIDLYLDIVDNLSKDGL
ncbi:unnamed protein product [Ambrosiozyma monospora]|uniref:Unnamed protein product n=1 Tax=Ambrosiozyma monospora TaxID=43982 RepID=A0ACB5T0X3_AMBMO|nr:unnamed protein product [Ambrosiozyma monospora]